ncbi:hypothetical protein RJ55_04156 [Drechmeria coniospora]|nr:hypothetical protein RJ55_04156 [Drechmeria coniospora]
METLTPASATVKAAATLCSTTITAATGLLTIAGGPASASVALAKAIVYEVPCPTVMSRLGAALPTPDGATGTSTGTSTGLHGASPNQAARVSDFRDPFYSSTFPICYALAATTVTAYMLLIMLFITPRSFLDGGVIYLGRRGGFTRGASGGDNIGGRPWLQKVATLTVAVSLTIATHDTFQVAQRQYQWGVQNSKVLQTSVMGSMELRVIRVISNTFLWLAQAQTLIRLFPRHREKVIIKWAAFGLITLDLIFSALNSFKDPNANPNPMVANFNHPIPALAYLFQLLLGVLYAAWVVYYALMKKRYAFYHPLMKNMPLLAIISLVAVLIPVVFFIMDISKPEFTGWGDYVRWVGAAAASVIVWEWVERIEALEREEKKDGILGREVFDGDETLEAASDATTRTPDPFPAQHVDEDLARDDSLSQSRRASEDEAAMRHAAELPTQLPTPDTSTDLEANAGVPLRSSRWRLAQRGSEDKPEAEVQAREMKSPRRTDSSGSDSGTRAGTGAAAASASGRWDIRSRFEMFAANQADKIREKLRPTADTVHLPTQYIPPPPRRGAALQQVLEEEELQGSGMSDASNGRRPTNGSLSRQDGRDDATQPGRPDGTLSLADDGPLLSTNPPLWPGVRRRVLTFESDDDDDDDDDGDEGEEDEEEDEEANDAHDGGGDPLSSDNHLPSQPLPVELERRR